MRTNSLAALLWLNTLVFLALAFAQLGTGTGLLLLLTAGLSLLAALSCPTTPGPTRR